eukprot:UN07632
MPFLNFPASLRDFKFFSSAIQKKVVVLAEIYLINNSKIRLNFHFYELFKKEH